MDVIPEIATSLETAVGRFGNPLYLARWPPWSRFHLATWIARNAHEIASESRL